MLPARLPTEAPRHRGCPRKDRTTEPAKASKPPTRPLRNREWKTKETEIEVPAAIRVEPAVVPILAKQGYPRKNSYKEEPVIA